MVTSAAEETGTLSASSLMDRVRLLEQRGKHILEGSSRTSFVQTSLRRALSTNNILSYDEGLLKFDTAKSDIPMTEEKRPPMSFFPPLPPLPICTARRLFRSSVTLNQHPIAVPGVSDLSGSPKSQVEILMQGSALRPGTPDALWSLQQELSQLALQREEERVKLTTALNQMRSSTEQARAEFDRRLVEKEEALSRLEYNYEQSNRRVVQLEEELVVTHEVLTSQERELDRLRSELSLHSNAANQLRTLLNEVTDKMASSLDSEDVSLAQPLPPPSCQSVMVLAHSVSSCIRNAWDQAAAMRAICDRLNSEITNVKMDCARAIERTESEKARSVAAIQAEAEHALKLGQQRLSAAQDRLRALEDQLDLTRDDYSKQIASRDVQIENFRAEMCKLRETTERERSEAIARATDAERLFADSETSRLRATAIAADADARSRQLELELDEIKRRYSQLESELAGEHDKLCRIWQVDDNRTNRMRESESRESVLRRRIAELEDEIQANISEFEKTISDLTTKYSQAEEELVVAKERTVALSTELEKAIQFSDKYKNELDRVGRIAEEAEKRQEGVSMEHSNAIKLLDEAEAKIVSLEKAKERYEEELAEARKDIEQLRKDSIASRVAATESVKSAQVLAKRHRELETQAREESSKLREEVDKLLKNLGEQEARLATLAAEKKQLEALLGCQQSEQLIAMRALAKKLAAAERQLGMSGRSDESDQRKAPGRSELDSLAAKLRITEERLEDALSECKEAVTRRKEAEKHAKDAVGIIEFLKDKLGAEQNRVDFLHREAGKFNAEAKQYRARLEAAAAYVSRLEAEVVRRTKAGLVLKEALAGKPEKTIFSVFAEKDDSNDRHHRRKSKHRSVAENANKQLVLSPKVLSPIFMDRPAFTSNHEVVIVSARSNEKCHASSS